jgi:hypothetical protein
MSFLPAVHNRHGEMRRNGGGHRIAQLTCLSSYPHPRSPVNLLLVLFYLLHSFAYHSKMLRVDNRYFQR